MRTLRQGPRGTDFRRVTGVSCCAEYWLTRRSAHNRPTTSRRGIGPSRRVGRYGTLPVVRHSSQKCRYGSELRALPCRGTACPGTVSSGARGSLKPDNTRDSTACSLARVRFGALSGLPVSCQSGFGSHFVCHQYFGRLCNQVKPVAVQKPKL